MSMDCMQCTGLGGGGGLGLLAHATGGFANSGSNADVGVNPVGSFPLARRGCRTEVVATVWEGCFRALGILAGAVLVGLADGRRCPSMGGP